MPGRSKRFSSYRLFFILTAVESGLEAHMSQTLVSLENGIPSTTSLKVSEVFHKRHTEVLRGIRSLCNNTPEAFYGRNFASVEYVDAKGERRPMYTMTRDGFTLLVMGYTGKDAMRFKLEYIEAFNAMEKELLRHQDSALSPDLRSELKSLVDAKLSMFPADIQGKARAEIWTRFNRHFRIAEYAQLPPEKMAEARAYIIELELRCLKSKATKETPALPAPQLFSMQTGQQEALRKLKEVLDTVRTSCHPGAVTMAMPPEARERYYRIHELYCASIDCLEAAYTILNTGNKLARA